MIDDNKIEINLKNEKPLYNDLFNIKINFKNLSN